MITHDLIIKALQTVIEVGMAVLVPIVIKYVLSKISENNLVRYMALAEMAVKMVQQTMDGVDNDTKKKAAMDKISQLTKGALSADEIEHLLEYAVYEMKNQYAKELNK